jgi:hypothetical protein
MSRKIESLTIEFTHNAYWFCQHGVYGRDSVIAGQDFRQLVQAYDSLAEAVAAHPEADVLEHEYKPENFVPDCEPEDFDTALAGEVWREEDY